MRGQFCECCRRLVKRVEDTEVGRKHCGFQTHPSEQGKLGTWAPVEPKHVRLFEEIWNDRYEDSLIKRWRR